MHLDLLSAPGLWCYSSDWRHWAPRLRPIRSSKCKTTLNLPTESNPIWIEITIIRGVNFTWESRRWVRMVIGYSSRNGLFAGVCNSYHAFSNHIAGNQSRRTFSMAHFQLEKFQARLHLGKPKLVSSVTQAVLLKPWEIRIEKLFRKEWNVR